MRRVRVRFRQAHNPSARNGAIIGKELSLATHPTGMLRNVAETADGGLKLPRLVASLAADGESKR